ncbi:B-cell lymphoma 3 protein, partial [Daubentonia madagascariensis]
APMPRGGHGRGARGPAHPAQGGRTPRCRTAASQAPAARALPGARRSPQRCGPLRPPGPSARRLRGAGGPRAPPRPGPARGALLPGPLHIAVVQGNLPAVHQLVNLFQHGGRELDIYNNLRQTPLHLAVITTLPSVVRLLVMAGASPMALDRHGQTAAHLACEHRSPTCLRALLDSAAPGTVDLEARNYDGLTALHLAVNTECQETVLLLLERGADIDAVDIKSGRSPLIHAVENNSLSMVQLLLQHGANVNAQMYSGSSALHSASGRGLLPLVRTLVRSGADSGLKNCHNDTPLMVARSRRVIDILRGKATRPASTSQPDPSPDRSGTTSPESNSRLSSNGLLSASPTSSPSQSPPKDPPGFPMAPPNFFLPPPSPPAFLPFAGVLRGPGRPVPPSPAPGGS